MKKLFDISLEEKQRILEMHESATKKNYLSEQVTGIKDNPVPKNVQSQIKGVFSWDKIHTIWRQSNQGYTPGNDFYWVTKHPSDGGYGNPNDASVLYLYTFNNNGNLLDQYTLQHYIGGNGQVWQIGGQTDIFKTGYQASAMGILSNLFIYNFDNPLGSTKSPVTLNKELYYKFLVDYVQKHPNSAVAKAFTEKLKIDDNQGMHKEQLNIVASNPIYKQLSAVAATPTTTPANTQR